MKILIIYGTIEGQTRKIARFMEEVLQEAGHQVTISNAMEEPPAPSNFDAVVVGSSIHMHKYNNATKQYIMDHVEALNGKPSAFFSVSMAVASNIPEEHEEAEKISKDFLEQTGWQTSTVWQIAGALRYTQYDYFKKLIMRMIAKKQGGATDTGKDHEYTDWEKTKKTILGFINDIG